MATNLTDRQICWIVAEAIGRAAAARNNWRDYVQSPLREAGVEVADEQPDGSDPWEIVRLADGRSVWLVDESAAGGLRYRVERLMPSS